jgi:hypothetical protein
MTAESEASSASACSFKSVANDGDNVTE